MSKTFRKDHKTFEDKPDGKVRQPELKRIRRERYLHEMAELEKRMREDDEYMQELMDRDRE